MKLKSKNMRNRKKTAKRLPFDLSYTQSRELSWLQFNARVLYEASDVRVPLYERLRFAAIFSSNLDEFFMVRVGSLSGLSLLPDDGPDSTCGWTAAEQLERIWEAAGALYDMRDGVVKEIEASLQPFGFQRVRRKHLEEPLRTWLDRYFQEEVQPRLFPRLFHPRQAFPHLEGGAFYVVLRLEAGEEAALGLVPVPEDLPKLVLLPGETTRFILMEQLIRDYAPRLFPAFVSAGRAVIRVTRSADLSPDGEGDAGDYREQVRQVLAKRPKLKAIRLEVQGKLKMPAVRELCAQLGMTKDQVFWSKCPLSMGYVWQLADRLLQFRQLFYPPHTPRYPQSIDPGRSMIRQVLERDRLLHYPYESMEPFLSLLREAAEDPQTTAVQLTVYRVAKQSRVLESVMAAARNGKAVTVLFELRARFDEQNNLEWAERLEKAGCKVIYGMKGVKCHAKLCLITRLVEGETQYITQIGTGNYNEKTAAQYTDLCLMTADPEIGTDAARIFESLSAGIAEIDGSVLWVAPVGIKPRMRALIEGEAAKARAGQPCGITMKCNSLTDREIIDALQGAAAAGVPVCLLVRGICCLVPGIEGVTENLHVYSIVGRFLEHARIYAFGAGQETLFIGSSDLMTRNLDRRNEVLCPVRSPEVAEAVRGILLTQLSDTAKRHELDHKKGYLPVGPPESGQPFEAQAFFQSGGEMGPGLPAKTKS